MDTKSVNRMMLRQYLLAEPLRRSNMILSALMLAEAVSNNQILPPQVSQRLKEISQVLVTATKTRNIENIVGVLQDDLVVSLNGKVIATSRSDWVKLYSSSMAPNGINEKVVSAVAGPNDFVHVVTFDSRGSFEPNRQHCCVETRFVRYVLGRDKVSNIQIFTTGTELLEAK